MKLKDKVAIVTGASRGIGEAIAIGLARGGANVVVNGRNPERTEKVAREIRQLGGNALPIVADLSQNAEVTRMVERTISELGRVDILVNNAVYVSAYGSSEARLFHQTDPSDWEPHFNMTLKGTLFCCRTVIPHMIDQKKGGRIINITSESARIAMKGLSIYAACKGAIASFSRCLSKEVGPYGILVNCVSPGVIATDNTVGFPEKLKAKMEAATSVGRLGQPEDIANMVVFLVSDKAKHITGQQFSVNGGSDCF